VRDWSWIVNALPYFEQQQIYDSINHDDLQGNRGTDVVPNPVANIDLRKTVLTALLCPSNDQEAVVPNQNAGYREGSSGGPPAARTDYVGNMGHIWGGWRDCGQVPDVFGGLGNYPGPTPWVNGDWDVDLPRCQGMFNYRGSFRMSDITDGTAQTIALYEDYHWIGVTSTGKLDTGNTHDSAWMSPLAAIGNLRNPMNNLNPAWNNPADWEPRCHGWSSKHPGGAQCAFADGSVKFYSQDITPVLKRALATRNGGEEISVNP
jgi:prepilin-type processing-associated H-X9-DG protein